MKNMHKVFTTQRVKLSSLVALAWLVTGCGGSSSGSDSNTADDISISLSLTRLELSTTPGGPAVNVNGLPVVSKRLLLPQNSNKSQ
jgi:hypothetical protein